MASDLTGLLIANLAYALVGGGLFVALGFVDRRRSTWPRLLAAHLFGVAVVVIPASYLALAGVGLGWTALSVVAAACVLAGVLRLRRTAAVAGEGSAPSRSPLAWADLALAVALTGAAVALLLYATRTFAVKPLVEWDGWTLWTLKARVLYEVPSSAPSVLHERAYGAPSYPLGLPTLEALGFRAMGRYDGTLIGIQLLLLAFGLVGALTALAHRRARASLVALAVLALVSAPEVLSQLSTHYADIPLAIVVAAGVAAGGAWLADMRGDTWAIVCFAAFIGFAGLIKNEGLLFAFAAVVALVACAALAGRERLRAAAFAGGAVLGIVLPWRVYAAAHDLRTYDYELADALDPGYLREHSSRVWPAVSDLVHDMTVTSNWGLAVPIVLLALLSGALSRRWLVSLYAAIWLALSFAGLVVTYWISVLPIDSLLLNSSYRTIASLLVGGVALTPLLLFAEPLPSPRWLTSERWRRVRR
jgi:hypothetical protein